MAEMARGYPRRSDVWLGDLGGTAGREQAGLRPVVVLSADAFNRGPAELVVVVPLTTTERRVPTHVEVRPPDGGLDTRSFALCENVRSVSRGRLKRRLGTLSKAPMGVIEDRLRVLMDL